MLTAFVETYSIKGFDVTKSKSWLSSFVELSRLTRLDKGNKILKSKLGI